MAASDFKEHLARREKYHKLLTTFDVAAPALAFLMYINLASYHQMNVIIVLKAIILKQF